PERNTRTRSAAVKDHGECPPSWCALSTIANCGGQCFNLNDSWETFEGMAVGKGVSCIAPGRYRDGGSQELGGTSSVAAKPAVRVVSRRGKTGRPVRPRVQAPSPTPLEASLWDHRVTPGTPRTRRQRRPSARYS